MKEGTRQALVRAPEFYFIYLFPRAKKNKSAFVRGNCSRI